MPDPFVLAVGLTALVALLALLIRRVMGYTVVTFVIAGTIYGGALLLPG